jgi:hypothetical protein
LIGDTPDPDSLFIDSGLIFYIFSSFVLFWFSLPNIGESGGGVGWGGGLIAVFLDNEVKGGLLMTAPFFLSLSLPSEMIKREREKKKSRIFNQITANFKASKVEMLKVI